MPQAYVVDSIKKARDLAKDSSFFVINLQTITFIDAGLSSKDKEELDQSYLNCLAQLAKKNNQLFWWANNVSEKNELLSAFFTRLMKLYLCKKILANLNNPENVIIVCEDIRLFGSLRSFLSKKFEMQDMQLRLSWLGLCVRNVARYIVKSVLTLVQVLYRHYQSKRILGSSIRAKIKNFSGVVIKTWIDQRSYNAQHKYQDAYFGELIPFMKKQGDTLLWGDIIQDYKERLSSIRQDNSVCIIPTEFFLKSTDIFCAFWDSCRFHQLIKDPVLFEEIDIRDLINDEITEGFFSLRFFDNILYYYKTKALVLQLNVKKFIYTFENYAWEKMCIAAFRQFSSRTKVVGFQHAFISNNSFKYFLGKGEFERVPKPDRIFTMGKVTNQILASKGWEDSVLTIGCALRQTKTLTQEQVNYGKNQAVLVVFPMMFQESVSMLQFLYDARINDQVILRFHPQTQIKQVLSALPFTLSENFIISSKSLKEDLQQAGVVLYTVSTVAIEALKVGLPVIYLNLNPYVNLDPLFGWNYLKKEVAKPKELSVAIKDLTSLNEEQYKYEFEASSVFVKDYFHPVTEGCLNNFSQ